MKRDIKRRNSEFHGKPGRDGVVLGKNSCLPRHGNRPDSRESETPDEPLVSGMPHVSRGSHGGSLPQIGISGKDRQSVRDGHGRDQRVIGARGRLAA